jgi:signal transduction histidine kinase
LNTRSSSSQGKLPKSSIIILSVIGVVAIALSILSFQYHSFTLTKIEEVAAEDIRLNAKIQSRDLVSILEREIERVSSVLDTLTVSPPIQNGDLVAASNIINHRQEVTNDITEFYLWLDQNGKVLWSSGFVRNESVRQQFQNADLSNREYFAVPKETGERYYTSQLESLDGIPRIFLAMPVFSQTEGGGGGTTSFIGVVVAGIKSTTIGQTLKEELQPGFESRVSLIDRNGIVLYTRDTHWIGKNISSDEMQAEIAKIISPEMAESLPELIKEVSGGEAGSIDAVVRGQMTTAVYQPVLFNGEHLMTLSISAPHTLAGDVGLLIEQQRNFSIIITTAIGAVAVGIAFLVLTWNRRLEGVVEAKTAELRQANQQLKIHDRMQKEFINVAAHELRTPIVPILGYSELLYSRIKGRQQQKGQGQQEEEEILETILRNANRLHQLTEDILDVTRIESNTLKLRKERFNLNDVILNVVEDYRKQIAANSNIKLIHELANSTTFIVEADRRRLTQVISNLLDNAIKFTKEGTVTVTTTIRGKKDLDGDSAKEEEKKEGAAAAAAAEEVVIAVKDTGTGIDPELIPRLFTKFATKSYRGTGLGLFISKSIVEAHGGKMWAQNNNNEDGSDSDRKHKGAIFYFTLPVVAMSEEERREEKKEVRLLNDQLQ